MKASKLLKRSDVFEASGTLPQVADRATAAGFRYFLVNGKVFELDSGRAEGSSLGMRSLKGAELVD